MSQRRHEQKDRQRSIEDFELSRQAEEDIKALMKEIQELKQLVKTGDHISMLK